MTPDSPAIAAKRHELHYLHLQYSSWRLVRKYHFPTVPAGTLNTIALGGDIPKKHRRALGLAGRRRERTEFEKHVATMVRATKKALKVKK
jgi:hypothetical protein